MYDGQVGVERRLEDVDAAADCDDEVEEAAGDPPSRCIFPRETDWVDLKTSCIWRSMRIIDDPSTV